MPSLTQPGDPDAVGMDEDYDACDLENWFLAIQSADGQVIIPSFHRPGIIRYDPKNGVNDWARTNPAGNWADSAARILRPVAADGHDPATFPDLVPDPATGKITFDVDNDADGVTDSVWLDLGYPARPDASGQLYKPLFAFMVIGLNGRIPLNTAGNLAGTTAPPTPRTSAIRSASSTPPMPCRTPTRAPRSTPIPSISAGIGTPPYTSNTQVDNAGIDVRLTQLRNLLAGTRPQPNPTTSDPLLADPHGTTNGDDNFVFGAWAGIGGGQPYFMPNGIADPGDILISTNPPRVQRHHPGRPRRWGEAPSIPGVPFTAAGGQVLNLVANPYNNPVRAGYSFGHGRPAQRACPAPPPTTTTTCSIPSRSATPARSTTATSSTPPAACSCPWTACAGSSRRSTSTARARCCGGASPGPRATSGPTPSGGSTSPAISGPRRPGRRSASTADGATPGAIVYPSAGNDLFYTSGPNPANLVIPVLFARRHQQPAPWLRGGQEPEPPRCRAAAILPRPSAACPPIRTSPRASRSPTRPTTSTSAPTG